VAQAALATSSAGWGDERDAAEALNRRKKGTSYKAKAEELLVRAKRGSSEDDESSDGSDADGAFDDAAEMQRVMAAASASASAASRRGGSQGQGGTRGAGAGAGAGERLELFAGLVDETAAAAAAALAR